MPARLQSGVGYRGDAPRRARQQVARRHKRITRTPGYRSSQRSVRRQQRQQVPGARKVGPAIGRKVQKQQRRQTILAKEKREIRAHLRAGKSARSLSARKRRILQRNPLLRPAGGTLNLPIHERKPWQLHGSTYRIDPKTGRKEYRLSKGGLKVRGRKSGEVWAPRKGEFERAAGTPVGASALKALEQTTRPVHAIAGGSRAAIRGEDIPRAVRRGAALKDKHLFSDVLKEAGAPKWLQSTGGFALDVAADPTTYLSFGAGVPAKAIAKKVERETLQAAERAGKSPRVARRSAAKAGRKAAERAPQNKGLRVGFAGKKTTGKTTARISRKAGISKTATRVRESGPVQAIGRDINPRFRPKNISERDFTHVAQERRRARAGASRGRFRAIQLAQSLKNRIPSEDFERVVNAIERGTVYDLPARLHEPARAVELAFRRGRRQETKAGIKVGSRRNYFAHVLEETLQEQTKKGARRSGTRVLRPEYGKARRYEGTVKQIREAHPGVQFSENVPLVTARRLSASARDVAQAKLNRSFLKVGRRVKKGEDIQLREGEALFRIDGSDLEKIARKEERRALSGDVSKLRVLDENLVEQSAKSVIPGATRSSFGRGYDKVQGGFKWVATVPNPGYHFRNLFGDTQNAYLAESAPRLARNTALAAGALRQLGKHEEALRVLGKRADPTGRGLTIKDARGRKVHLTFDQLVREAESAGAIRSGFIAKELPELLRDADKAVKRTGSGKGRRFARLIQNREDLMRLATYIGGRKRGLSADEASARAARFHFDYADLTEFERTFLRRVFPFYTFTARNIPLQAKTLVTKPGKYANIEKLREEAAKTGGFSEDWQEQIREYQQRGVPIPISWKGHKFAVSPALPIADLNQLPTSANPLTFLDESMRKALSMANPVIKSPLELYANYSFFFRGQIKRDESPLVAAPSYVAGFPKAWQKRLGIVPDYTDKRTGKKGWGWPAKLDYVAKVPPGPTNFIQQMMTKAPSRRGLGSEGRALSYLGGLKADPFEPNEALLERLYDEKSELEVKRAGLGQRGQGSASVGRRETKGYRSLRDRLKQIDDQILKLRKQRGDKILRGRRQGSGGGGDPLFGGGGGSSSRTKDPLFD